MDRARDILLGLASDRADLQDWAGPIALACWEDAVGELLARVTRPATLANRLLIVEVEAAEWVPELEALSGAIRGRLNKALGRDVVGRVVYRLRRGGAKPAGRAETSLGEPADPIRRRIYRAAERRG